MPIDRPIPAFYCCYLLRSTVRHGSVYVGSTPHPVRRLDQHNGKTKGGAVRTSRASLRPWEMSCIVTGFPSHIAALQFEWAWQNPHITQHITPEQRLQHAAGKKRSGQPKRPKHTVSSLLSNLHLLLRAPSFSRWPLDIRFFSEDVHRAWVKWTKIAANAIPNSTTIIQDYPPKSLLVSKGNPEGSPGTQLIKLDHGIQALKVDYLGQKPHVEKAKEIFDFEREGSCAVCEKNLEHDGGVYTTCPNSECQSVSHLTCLSKHFLEGDQDALVPISGKCPRCKATLQWVDIAKELTLRLRGQKEVEKLLKAKREKNGKAMKLTEAILEFSDNDFEDEGDEGLLFNDFKPGTQSVDTGDSWHAINDSDDSEAGSVTSNASQGKGSSSYRTSMPVGLKTVIEDSDWDDAEILD